MFLGYANKVAIFWGRETLKLGFVGVQNINHCQTPIPHPIIKLFQLSRWEAPKIINLEDFKIFFLLNLQIFAMVCICALTV